MPAGSDAALPCWECASSTSIERMKIGRIFFFPPSPGPEVGKGASSTIMHVDTSSMMLSAVRLTCSQILNTRGRSKRAVALVGVHLVPAGATLLRRRNYFLGVASIKIVHVASVVAILLSLSLINLPLADHKSISSQSTVTVSAWDFWTRDIFYPSSPMNRFLLSGDARRPY